MQQTHILAPLNTLPREEGWLARQAFPVIAHGKGETNNADVVVASESAANSLVRTIERTPIAAMTLVQVLRATEAMPIAKAMTLESLAYSTLQAGSEYGKWLKTREQEPQLICGGEGRPIELERDGAIVTGRLNRAVNRNAISVEMRDALVELFELILADSSIEQLKLSAKGGCFSVGGELREFGLATDPAMAHYIRSAHNPGQLIALCSARVSCHLHSACIGSGIEIPAFAGTVSASNKTFFQLPELQFGLIPGAGGCVSIPRRIGRQRTAWLALSGKKITAPTALAWGLIDKITDNY
jgi:enoyl-CoA hydratase/carnithine racemase